jgi:hypothetical protein
MLMSLAAVSGISIRDKNNCILKINIFEHINRQ